MKPDERIVAIRAIADALENAHWDDIHLIVKEFKLPTPKSFEGDKREYIYAVLKLSSDLQLQPVLEFVNESKQSGPHR